ncbi:DUF2249 domain-containing protein [Oceanobacillus alkalisoli]|uniref:DUF2249 domain-containing protein n=1 Tax=Oceanobacillus alkalisoli TaxID=2925113 RepID=UPI001EF0645E|nr:DUF2249 domain-containing protein [Oceanobacillus alkalisoli]MCF3944356.1 DUF2249 domain-containing protein [Oceanobacillus alkalisoli]MCG5104848.1 DUF2249 domain-containing protein [Oceanobacillus alkalisoli]
MNKISCSVKVHAPDIPPKSRHIRIFWAFDKLEAGECMQLTNDHDPKPLYYQFLIEREGEFTWKYMEEGPDLWRVIIGKKE